MTTEPPLDVALSFTIGYGVPGYGEEGGEADDPSDPGGFTWRGITLSAYRAWLNDDTITSDQLLALTEAEIVAFYGACYWNPINGDALPAPIGPLIFDFGVNAGPYEAATTLQGCVGVGVDGSIGPETLAATRAANATWLVGLYTQRRIAFYRSLPSFGTFGAGWTARAQRCEAFATNLLLAPADQPAVNAGLWLQNRAAGQRLPAPRVTPRLRRAA